MVDYNYISNPWMIPVHGGFVVASPLNRIISEIHSKMQMQIVKEVKWVSELIPKGNITSEEAEKLIKKHKIFLRENENAFLDLNREFISKLKNINADFSDSNVQGVLKELKRLMELKASLMDNISEFQGWEDWRK